MDDIIPIKGLKSILGAFKSVLEGVKVFYLTKGWKRFSCSSVSCVSLSNFGYFKLTVVSLF